MTILWMITVTWPTRTSASFLANPRTGAKNFLIDDNQDGDNDNKYDDDKDNKYDDDNNQDKKQR